MDLMKLRYFRAVAQTEHISKAAERLHITQPALSKTIAMLEEELGVPLFNRVGRRIELNEYGATFLKYAEKAINAVEGGIAMIEEMENPSTSKIKFQTNIINDRYLIHLMTGFRKKFPEVRFEVIKNYTKTKYLNKCDLYIHAKQIPLYNCTSIPIFKEEILLGVPTDHPLSKFDHIHLEQAAQEAFISLEMSTSWYDETEKFCIKAGFHPHLIYQCDGTEMVGKLIAAGEGVGFLPATSWTDPPGGVKLLHIDDQSCTREYNLSWLTDTEPSKYVKEFRTYIQKYFSQYTDNNPIEYM